MKTEKRNSDESNFEKFFVHLKPTKVVIDNRIRKFEFTLCGLYDKNSGSFYVGGTSKSAYDKNYSRKIANQVAIGRALKRPTHKFVLDQNLPRKDVRNKLFTVASEYETNPAEFGKFKNFQRSHV